MNATVIAWSAGIVVLIIIICFVRGRIRRREYESIIFDIRQLQGWNIKEKKRNIALEVKIHEALFFITLDGVSLRMVRKARTKLDDLKMISLRGKK